MLSWVLYDISDDDAREQIAKRCLQAGLTRVQQSVFFGAIEPTRLDELEMVLAPIMNPETDSIYLAPYCRKDFRRLRMLGRGFDRGRLGGEERRLIL